MKILLIGDTIIDQDIYLKGLGLSLESPTIKTKFLSKKICFGGAANVAKNLSKFNIDITFLTSLSNTNLAIFKNKFPTIKIINYFQGKDNLKSRYWINHGDSDYKYLQINDVNENTNNSIKLIDLSFSDFEVIAFSDYRCGLINKKLISECLSTSIKTFASSQISSQPSNYEWYKDVDIIVCNEKESSFVDRQHNICITKGHNGCTFNGIQYDSYPIKKPVNPIGAGDCFYAAFIATENPQISNKKAAEFLSEN